MTIASDPHALIYGNKLTPEEAQSLTRRLLSSCDDGELYMQFIASEVHSFPGFFLIQRDQLFE